MAEKLMLTLLMIRDRQPDVFGAIPNWVYPNWTRFSPEENPFHTIPLIELVNQALRREGDWSTEALNQCISELADQLIESGKGDRAKQDKDLISAVVRILQLPYAQNVISGENLSALRDAILLPAEKAARRARLDENRLSCGRCGKTIGHGEAVTVSYEIGLEICCFSCMEPSQMACANRTAMGREKSHTIPFPKTTTAAMNKHRKLCVICKIRESERTNEGAEVGPRNRGEPVGRPGINPFRPTARPPIRTQTPRAGHPPVGGTWLNEPRQDGIQERGDADGPRFVGGFENQLPDQAPIQAPEGNVITQAEFLMTADQQALLAIPRAHQLTRQQEVVREMVTEIGREEREE